MRYIGILLVVVGAVLLFKNLGYIAVAVWDIVWPIAVVLAGLALITKHRHHWYGMWGGCCKGDGGDCKNCKGCTCRTDAENNN
jgi:hypothetical protein